MRGLQLWCFLLWCSSPFAHLHSMFSAFSHLLTARISPCSWCPSDPVSSGSTSSTQHLKLPLSSLSSLSFSSAGSWAHGTIFFDVGEGRHPPSYDIAVTAPHAMRDEKVSGGQLKDGEGFLEVTVESRWNDQSLSEESNVTLNRAGQHGVELRVHASFWQGVARPGAVPTESHHCVISCDRHLICPLPDSLLNFPITSPSLSLLPSPP